MCSVMPSTSNPQNQQNIFQRQQNGGFAGKTHGGVWQDKGASLPGRTASQQPASVGISPRANDPNPPKEAGRVSHPHVSGRKAVKVTLWVRPEVKDELERIARREAASISAIGSAFLERSLQTHIDMQYGALLTPIIEQAINNRFRARDARFAALLVRIAYDVGQTRSLVTNLFARAPGLSPDILDARIDQSAKRAKANLTHLSPWITQLMQAVDQWLGEEAEEEERLVS